MLVKNIKSHSTFAVRGLDLQLFQQLNETTPNSLVSIADLNINMGSGLFPYLQPNARSGLIRAIERYGKPITINSGYRSVVAQSMLYSQWQRGIITNLVAFPGRSDHQSGSCVDIDEWATAKQAFLQSGFEWTYGLKDAMHFDFPGKDIRDDSIKAFQSLWNDAFPFDKIPVDGDLGKNTLNKILNSPAEGFNNIRYPRIMKLTDPIQEGNDIGELQLALRKAGVKVVIADKKFGEGTDQAVKQYQKLNNLDPDGIVGAKTRELLGI